eukprot:Pgem_evm1s13716
MSTEKRSRVRRCQKDILRDFKCEYPGCRHAYNTRRAMKLHVQKKHYMTLAEVEELKEKYNSTLKKKKIDHSDFPLQVQILLRERVTIESENASTSQEQNNILND